MYSFLGLSGLIYSSLVLVGVAICFSSICFLASEFTRDPIRKPDAKAFAAVSLIGLIGVGGIIWSASALPESSSEAATQEAETRLSTLDNPTSAIDKEDILVFPSESDLSSAPWYVISPASAEGDNRFATHVQCITPDGEFHAATPKELAEAGAVIISHGQPEKAAPFNKLQQE